MTTALATPEHAPAALLEQVLIDGNLDSLTPAQRLDYYQRVCTSLGLNQLTKPFQYLRLQGSRLTLYATRDATDQLRRIYGVSVTITAREHLNDVYVVTARATMPDGRTDESIGAVPVANLKGDSLANAFMKAETKSKRRVTLSICGLGMLDETEIETIPEAQKISVNADGEILNETARQPSAPAAAPQRQANDVEATAMRNFGMVCKRLKLEGDAIKRVLRIDPNLKVSEWGEQKGWVNALNELVGYEDWLRNNPGVEGDAAIFQ